MCWCRHVSVFGVCFRHIISARARSHMCERALIRVTRCSAAQSARGLSHMLVSMIVGARPVWGSLYPSGCGPAILEATRVCTGSDMYSVPESYNRLFVFILCCAVLGSVGTCSCICVLGFVSHRGHVEVAREPRHRERRRSRKVLRESPPSTDGDALGGRGFLPSPRAGSGRVRHRPERRASRVPRSRSPSSSGVSG